MTGIEVRLKQTTIEYVVAEGEKPACIQNRCSKEMMKLLCMSALFDQRF
jgi:hypothetical protein